MRNVKLEEITYDVMKIDENGYDLITWRGGCKTVKEAEDAINNERQAKYFAIYKTLTNRTLIKIKEVEVRPCSGGWSGGHSPIDKISTETWCSGCGYKLKKIQRNYNDAWILKTPHEHKPDSKELLTVLQNCNSVKEKGS